MHVMGCIIGLQRTERSRGGDGGGGGRGDTNDDDGDRPNESQVEGKKGTADGDVM